MQLQQNRDIPGVTYAEQVHSSIFQYLSILDTDCTVMTSTYQNRNSRKESINRYTKYPASDKTESGTESDQMTTSFRKS